MQYNTIQNQIQYNTINAIQYNTKPNTKQYNKCKTKTKTKYKTIQYNKCKPKIKNKFFAFYFYYSHSNTFVNQKIASASVGTPQINSQI